MCNSTSEGAIETSQPGIHNRDREYGFRACASGRQLPTAGASRNDNRRQQHVDDSKPFRFENHPRRHPPLGRNRDAYSYARPPRRRWPGRTYPLRADVHFVDRAEGAAVASAVSDAAMSVASIDPRNRETNPETNRETNRDASADDGVGIHPQGSFFGRRKGHKLRSHQADLIEHLLPRLSLDIASPSPPDLADLFDPLADDIRLEIGFGSGEHLIAEARAFPKVGFIGCEPYVNGMAKILAQIEARNIGNVRLFAGDAAELLAWAPPAS